MPPRPIILIAEDDPSDQLLLRRAIAQARLEVDPEFVHDGKEAVDYLCARAHVPLLLLDLRMPRMSGFEVLKWLQEHPEVRPDHVVVLSSCAASRDLNASGRLGVDHYIVKPCDVLELSAAMKRLEPYWTSPAPTAWAA